MTNFIKTQFFYTSNFPYKSGVGTTTFGNFIKSKRSDKIICKNFLILYVFLKILNKKNTQLPLFTIKINSCSNPGKKNIINLLKAPYKNKLARNQITTPLFKFSIKITYIYLKDVMFSNPNYFLIFLNLLLNSFGYFESNVTYLNKLRVAINFKVTDYWNYKF